MSDPNLLYYGDNLDVLRRHIADNSVDLVYLDPPFNSNQDFNVLYAERDGTKAAAQIMAFEDTWQWNTAAAEAYEETVERGGHVATALRAFRDFLGPSDMLAYLSMMAPRLVELRRVLKPTGSLYLHCDPTSSHYLKMLLDGVFGPSRLRSEIVWKRSSAHSDTKQGLKKPGRIHDVIFFYTKGDNWTWNPQFTPYADSYVGRDYKHVDEETGRRFRRGDLTAAKPGGDTEYLWRVKKREGVKERWQADLTDDYLDPQRGWEYQGVPPYKGRYWAYSQENMRQFAREGRLRHTYTGTPEYKRYLDEMPGVALQDLWTDITPLISGTAERLGYPTQKPEALLERIILSSSNEGDVVLDPFCGCGTTIAAAQKLGRRWIGIDITHLAIGLNRHRLVDAYGPEIEATFAVRGEPVTVGGAEELAGDDPYQFQFWALGLVGARPAEEKRGADRGIDGRLYFHDGRGGRTRQVILQVKAGHLTASHVRDLRGVLARERAEIAALISFEEPTKAMREEAADAGFYESDWGRHPRIQLLTVGELLDGKQLDYPRTRGSNVTFRQAPRVRRPEAGQLDFLTGEESPPEKRRRRRSRKKQPASPAAPKSKAKKQPAMKPGRARRKRGEKAERDRD